MTDEPTNDPPLNPTGPPPSLPAYSQQLRDNLIAILRDAPVELRQSVADLDKAQLDTRYRNWTIRQIAHHLGDSHLHAYVRFKYALTEDRPTIKPYAEGDWSLLYDAVSGPVGPTLDLFAGLHERWCLLLAQLNEDQLSQTFFHPEHDRALSLWEALNYYAWHSQHHVGQILWVRRQRGW